MKGHKLKAFSPKVVDSFSDEFYGIWFFLAVLGGVFGTMIGFFENPWFFAGWILAVLGVVYAGLAVSHEAFVLNGTQKKLYDAYSNLPKELCRQVPKLTAELIGGFTDTQVHLLLNEIKSLHALERDKQQALKELDPTATHILEALRDLQKVSRHEIDTLKKLREMK